MGGNNIGFFFFFGCYLLLHDWDRSMIWRCCTPMSFSPQGFGSGVDEFFVLFVRSVIRNLDVVFILKPLFTSVWRHILVIQCRVFYIFTVSWMDPCFLVICLAECLFGYVVYGAVLLYLEGLICYELGHQHMNLETHPTPRVLVDCISYMDVCQTLAQPSFSPQIVALEISREVDFSKNVRSVLLFIF